MLGRIVLQAFKDFYLSERERERAHPASLLRGSGRQREKQLPAEQGGRT